ncbi:TIGR02679 family protein, partial [Mesorhizobium sp. M1A.F.Ca.ET.072.01.1.1]|uniref:TIGR02679 domain-containing protein n=1 Tax=Mesorhizobium sp. M1A.F.Ca.ET.072.01.1.1 TaxID=2496753 RepID=UPI000FD54F00
MSGQPDVPLQRLLGGDHLASLRRRLRQRFERAPLETIDHIRIDELGVEEHAALAGLLGRAPRHSKSLRIDVHAVDAALQHAGIASSLRDALEKLDGPIIHLAGTRLRTQTLWTGVIEGCGDSRLASLLRTPTGIGLIKRLARQDPEAAAQLCHRAEEVLRRLPADGITRSQLAADVLGDAHALDNGRGTAALVLAVWRQGTSPIADEGSERLTEPKDDPDA